MRDRRVRISHLISFRLGMIGLLACARIPPETVQLSAALEKDLASTHAAHLALVHAYFALVRRQMQSFIDTQYRPFLIRYLLTEERFDKEFAAAATSATNDSRALVDLAEVFTEELSSKVAEYLAHLTGPLDSMQQQAAARITARYSAMSSASAELTGYLGSLGALESARESTLARAGLSGASEDIARATATLSNRIAQLDMLAGDIEGRVRDGRVRLEEGLKEFQALRDSLMIERR